MNPLVSPVVASIHQFPPAPTLWAIEPASMAYKRPATFESTPEIMMHTTTTTTALSSARLEHNAPKGPSSAYPSPSTLLLLLTSTPPLVCKPSHLEASVELLLEIDLFELEFSYAFNPFDLAFGSAAKAMDDEYRAKFFARVHRVTDSSGVKKSIRLRERNGDIHYYLILPDDDDDEPSKKGQSLFPRIVKNVLSCL